MINNQSSASESDDESKTEENVPIIDTTASPNGSSSNNINTAAYLNGNSATNDDSDLTLSHDVPTSTTTYLNGNNHVEFIERKKRRNIFRYSRHR